MARHLHVYKVRSEDVEQTASFFRKDSRPYSLSEQEKAASGTTRMTKPRQCSNGRLENGCTYHLESHVIEASCSTNPPAANNTSPPPGFAPPLTSLKQIFEIFTDKSVRQQFEEYDAIAVIDWERIEVQEGGFERLYHAAFRQKQSQHSWWIMASDARPLDVAEARERRRHVEENNLGGSGGDGADGGGNYGQQLVWTINGKAVICKRETTPVGPKMYQGSDGNREIR